MPPVYGLHCSHEQIPPSRLLAHAREAEAAGFGAAMSSDHFSPWSERQGESGFSFAFLGAALATTSLPWGMVCAPGQRYHPAIVAQAIATLASTTTASSASTARSCGPCRSSRRRWSAPPCPRRPPAGAADGPTAW